MPRLAALPRWYRANPILAWMCILITVNQLGFGSIVPIVPLYAKTFDVSQFMIGLSVAIYGLARFVANMPTGRLADLLGRGSAIAIGGAITAVGNVVSGLAPSYTLFLGGRFIGGLGAATVLTGSQIILTDITTNENRGRVFGLYMTVFLFAVGVAPLPGGFIGQHVGLEVPFFVYAAFALLVIFIALTRLPDTRELRPAAVRAGTEPRATDQPRPPFSAQIRLLIRQPAFVLISIATFATYFARTGGVFTILPQRAQDSMGLSTGQIGLGLSAISIISLVIAYPSGVVIDRFGRKAVIVPAVLFGAVGMVCFALSTGMVSFVASCTVWGMSAGLAGAAPTAYAADVAPPGMNAAAMGTYRAICDSGYFFGPLSLGAIADLSGSGAALIATAVMLLIVGIGFGLIAPETHRVRQPAGVVKDATGT